MNCIIVTILRAQNALVRECETGGAKRRRESIIISVNHKKPYDIIHKLKNQLIFVTDKTEDRRKFVSQSEKRVSKSYKQ